MISVQRQQPLSNNYIALVKSDYFRLARQDFSFYCELTHRHNYLPAKHTEYIAKACEEVERGTLKRLMVFLPPRHSKSMTITETFPSWFIGRNPDRRVIEVSYGDAFAQKFGRANRTKLEEYGKQIFGISLDPRNSSVTNWGIAGHRGGMISAGVGGSITGEGADLLLIDDPIKNREEANSETYREKLWNEWQNTLLTRLQAGGAVILILTRWHEDDLAGRILQSETGDSWRVISLPAEAEDNDPIGRKQGDPLWPEGGFDSEWMKQKKVEIGSQTFTSLYQQRPSPQEGEMLKRVWWKFYTVLPSDLTTLQSWDCSFKDLDDSDYVVGQVWGAKGADRYLIDQVRGRMGFPATITAIKTLSAKHPAVITKLIEDKANGTAVIQVLKHEIQGIVPVEPAGGKASRVQSVSPIIEAGNVYLPDPSIAPWIHDFIEECAAFPFGKNDDQVDAMSQGLHRMNKPGSPRVLRRIF